MTENQTPLLSFIERKVMNHIAVEGVTQQEAARKIGISERRVKQIVEEIKMKTDCKRIAHLTYFLTKNNLI